MRVPERAYVPPCDLCGNDLRDRWAVWAFAIGPCEAEAYCSPCFRNAYYGAN